MWKDPIVEDVRKVRNQQAAIFDFDLFAILEDARKKQKTSGHKIVSFLCTKKKTLAKAAQPYGSTLNQHKIAGQNHGLMAKEDKAAYTMKQKESRQKGKYKFV